MVRRIALEPGHFLAALPALRQVAFGSPPRECAQVATRLQCQRGLFWVSHCFTASFFPCTSAAWSAHSRYATAPWPWCSSIAAPLLPPADPPRRAASAPPAPVDSAAATRLPDTRDARSAAATVRGFRRLRRASLQSHRIAPARFCARNRWPYWSRYAKANAPPFCSSLSCSWCCSALINASCVKILGVGHISHNVVDLRENAPQMLGDKPVPPLRKIQSGLYHFAHPDI